MEKKLTYRELNRLIRETIEDLNDINELHFDKEDFPEFFEEFVGTLGKDFLGYDYPNSPEEEADQFDIFMRYNHPDATPSAQEQVGYDDADSVEEIGDGLGDNVLGDLGISEGAVRQIIKNSVNEVIKSYKNKKNI